MRCLREGVGDPLGHVFTTGPDWGGPQAWRDNMTSLARTVQCDEVLRSEGDHGDWADAGLRSWMRILINFTTKAYASLTSFFPLSSLRAINEG